MLSVRLILDAVNRQWIIGKMAERLAEALRACDVDADIGEGPRDDVDVNHWMFYVQPWRHYYPSPGFFNASWRPAPTKHTAMITHVDDPLKVQILRDSIPKILDAGICMSRMTVAEVAGYGVDPARLTFISPAHDSAVTPRRIVVGMTTRRYPDGRKREDDLMDVARSMPLDAFRFEIIGEGWEDVAVVLRNAGAEVELFSELPYAAILERLSRFDYYLYMGWDEGSMGTLDALAAGVKTIVTPQGFHLDLPGGITHPFHSAEELTEVFRSIAAGRQQRMNSVKDLTWSEYARKHALVWRALLEGRPLGDIAANAGDPIAPAALAASRRRTRARLSMSEFWPYYIESRKFLLRGKASQFKRWLMKR
ncbi:MAG TPA: hypothetical protein VGJ82_18340 [Thermoanaerobaculia bacterium]|jgi:hypothetical protein